MSDQSIQDIGSWNTTNASEQFFNIYTSLLDGATPTLDLGSWNTTNESEQLWHIYQAIMGGGGGGGGVSSLGGATGAISLGNNLSISGQNLVGTNADGSASFAGGLTTIGTNGSMSIGPDAVTINALGIGDIFTAGPIPAGYLIINDGGADTTLYADESGGFSVGGNIAANGLILPNAASVTEGDFDNGTGGANGISLNCSLGYELNWQGGRLRAATIGTGGTPIPLVLDSDLTIGETTFHQDGSASFAAGILTFGSTGPIFACDFYSSGTVGAGNGASLLYSDGSASFAGGASGNDTSGVIYCNNPVTPTPLTVADSKVAMTIGGVTYYLLATTDPT